MHSKMNWHHIKGYLCESLPSIFIKSTSYITYLLPFMVQNTKPQVQI